tara:strand:- start:7727 stop:8593 length:867 start_codon:yes stop_codon:yes gene_type:complete
MRPINVGILGTGNIGTDLLLKVQKSQKLQCTLFSGRNLFSNGMKIGKKLGVAVSDQGVDAFFHASAPFDVIFDATSASAHSKNHNRLEKLGALLIDMTPAKIGDFCIPALGLDYYERGQTLNMVTCGGQASIPLIKFITDALGIVPEYAETISTIASLSAGPGTRNSLDEYIQATQLGIKQFTGAKEAKALINLNPATPPITMQTTVMIKCEAPNMTSVTKNVEKCLAIMQSYVPKYNLAFPPVYDENRECIIVGVKVEGNGDYLPKYAGNLDIINSAAIHVAERLAE